MSEKFWKIIHFIHRNGFGLLGLVIALYGGYTALVGEGAWVSFGAFMAGWMTVFLQVDRNVYYDRLRNLFAALDESELEIEIQRKNYVDYVVLKGK